MSIESEESEEFEVKRKKSSDKNLTLLELPAPSFPPSVARAVELG